MMSLYRMARFRLLANGIQQFSSRKTIGVLFRKHCISHQFLACGNPSGKVSKPQYPSAVKNLHGKLATCFYQASTKKYK